MKVPGLDEGSIRQHANAESFQRGQDYYRNGTVLSLVQRDDVLQAEVEGSQYDPYRVRVVFDQGGITETTCTCPYTWGGWCKHIVAVLLACLHAAEEIEVRPALDELLAGLDGEQLRGLVLDLATHSPGLANELEDRIALLCTALDDVKGTETTAPSPRRTTVDPKPIRRRVSGILHSLDRMRPSEAYWQVDSVVSQVGQVLDQAQSFVGAGDGENALVYLEAITDEYVEGWLYLDDSDGYAGGFFGTLGETWTRAALVAELSSEERKRWADKLTRWQSAIGDYGVDDVFDAAQAAFLQGWDYPPLRRVLQGEITQRGAWEVVPPWYADDLAAARLDILEQQERYQEFLYLAEAEGQMARYVLMLARLGRVPEAVDEGMRHLYDPSQLLELAKTLREQGALTEALRIAEHGLSHDGYKAPLANWLCDLALGQDKSDLALRAAEVACRADPGLDIYLRVQQLAGDRWPQIQESLLAYMRKEARGFSGGHIDILLYENCWDDAIAAVERNASYELLERVMDAVVEHRPEWVIQAARREAERIIEAGKSKYYHHAVEWLDRAQAAYRSAGREPEWQAYLSEIRELHGRKYKLMGMLKGV